MKTNNSYLKHQMKILAQSEGVTVEAREKAYKYVEKYIERLTKENGDLICENDALKADIAHKDATIEQLMKESAKSKTPVKKKTAAKKTVKK